MRAIILLQYFTTWEKVLDYINLLRLLSINIIIYLAFSTVLVPSVPPSGTEKKNLSNYFSFQKKFVKKKRKVLNCVGLKCLTSTDAVSTIRRGGTARRSLGSSLSGPGPFYLGMNVQPESVRVLSRCSSSHPQSQRHQHRANWL